MVTQNLIVKTINKVKNIKYLFNTLTVKKPDIYGIAGVEIYRAKCKIIYLVLVINNSYRILNSI